MDPATLPRLLGLAWLLPLASLVLIVFFGPHAGHKGREATYAIFTSFVLGRGVGGLAFDHPVTAAAQPAAQTNTPGPRVRRPIAHASARFGSVPAVSGEWYQLAQFRTLLNIGYIDADRGHVLHGHPGCLVHPRLLVRLHARGAKR